MSENQQGDNNPNYKGNVVVCIFCGKEFQAPPSHNRKYCSLECYWKVHPNRKLEQEGLKEKLRELYVLKKLTIIEIGKKFGCDPKTVTYWMDKFGIPRRSLSEALRGRKFTEETRRKMSEKAKLRGQKPEEKKRRSEVAKRLWINPNFRKRVIAGISKSLIGNKRRKGIHHTEETKRKISESSKILWKDPKYARKVITALQAQPNNSEMVLIKIIKENHFPFKYVGDGKIVIDGKVPDFISTDGSKKVIEFFGSPWHDPTHSDKIDVKYDRTEEGRKKFFIKHGYDCLVIWDDALGDEEKIVERIKTFIGAEQHLNLYEEVLEAS